MTCACTRAGPWRRRTCSTARLSTSYEAMGSHPSTSSTKRSGKLPTSFDTEPPAVRVRVRRCAHRREQHLRWSHAEGQAEGSVAIVGVEPIVSGAEDLTGGDQDGFVAGPGNLKKDPVLPLELDLLVIKPAGQRH